MACTSAVRFISYDGSDAILMARVIGYDGALITQASISTAELVVQLSGSPDETGRANLPVSVVVFDTPVVDDAWRAVSNDTVGYNLRVTAPFTFFPRGAAGLCDLLFSVTILLQDDRGRCILVPFHAVRRYAPEKRAVAPEPAPTPMIWLEPGGGNFLTAGGAQVGVGSNVYRWLDKSFQDALINQTDPARQPTHTEDVNSVNALTFDGIDDMLAGPMAPTYNLQNITVFAAIKDEGEIAAGFKAGVLYADTAWRGGWGITSVDDTSGSEIAIWVADYSDPLSRHTVTQASLADWTLIAIRYDQEDTLGNAEPLHFFINGAPAAQLPFNTALNFGASQLLFGDDRQAAPAFHWNLSIASLIYYPRALTDAEMTQTDAYIKQAILNQPAPTP